MDEPGEDALDVQVVRGPAEEEIEVPVCLPVLPLRDAVVYPGVTVQLSVGRRGSLAALDEAGEGGYLLAATQRNPATEEPTPDDLVGIGCIVRVIRTVEARRAALAFLPRLFRRS